MTVPEGRGLVHLFCEARSLIASTPSTPPGPPPGVHTGDRPHGEAVPKSVAGSPAEQPLLDEIRGRARVPDLRSYAPEPITDLARFLPRAALVIGNDTGPLHLAAVGCVPTIGLFGPTRGARNGPYGPSGLYIQSPSGRMSDISVESVFAEARRMLGAG